MVDQTTLDAPTIGKSGRVIVHVPDGTNTVGWLGTIPERDGNGLITERDSHKHRIRALDAYAFSISAIDTMRAVDLDYVLVAETDTGDVYEWKFDAIRYGDDVPDTFLEHPEDPQRFVPRDSARAIWRDHLDSVYRDEPESDVTLEGEHNSQGFEKASELDTGDGVDEELPDVPDGVDMTPEEFASLSDEERLEIAYERGTAEGGR